YFSFHPSQEAITNPNQARTRRGFSLIMSTQPTITNRHGVAMVSFNTPEVHTTILGQKRKAITAGKEEFQRDAMMRTRNQAPAKEKNASNTEAIQKLFQVIR